MRPLLWLNFLCLDAPLVAVVWQSAFANALGVGLRGSERAALFGTAWLIYLVDRWADVRLPSTTPAARSRRHDFCHRFSTTFLVAIGLVAAANAVLLPQLDRSVLIAGAATAVLAAAYLAVNLAHPEFWFRYPLKEVAISVLFAIGTSVALLARAASASLVFAVALFAGLSTLNVMSIAKWEQALDSAQGRPSLALTHPQLLRSLPVLAAALCGGAILLLLVDGRFAGLALSLAFSTVLLAVLDRARTIAPELRTALADLVLLTPLPFIPLS